MVIFAGGSVSNHRKHLFGDPCTLPACKTKLSATRGIGEGKFASATLLNIPLQLLDGISAAHSACTP